MKKIKILGETYTISQATVKQDEFLKNCDGYCDSSSHRIVIGDKPETNDSDDYEAYKKKVLRHEIVHAFLNESGLQENFEHANRWGHEETFVDWFAIQSPKIFKVYQELNIL